MSGDHEDNEVKSDVEKLSSFVLDSLPELEIELVDERLTTFEATRFKGGGKKVSRNDDLAAKIILQRYFDQI